MKSRRSILSVILGILVSLAAVAQEVIVTVTPVQQVLPPQVLMYIDNPGKYFTVSLTNTTNQEQQIYIGMQIEQVNPSVGLAISTPPKRQPNTPIRLAANSTVHLTSLEIKNLFKHIPSNEISCPAGLFDDYQNGSFALLPEGQYQAHMTAYRWSNPQYTTPLVVSNPTGGMAYFTVCYKAQAPQFLVPNPALAEYEMPKVNPLAAMFQWTEPTLTCAPSAQTYRYDFRVVELLSGQQYDDAMDHNPTLYMSKNNSSPVLLVPTLYMQRDFKVGKTYLAQVTAKPVTSSPLSYVMLENEGKSNYIPFQILSLGGDIDAGGGIDTGGGGDKGDETPEKDPKQDSDDDDGDDDQADDDQKGDGDHGSGGGLEWGSIDGLKGDVTIDIETQIDPDITEFDMIDLDELVGDVDLDIIWGQTSGKAEITDSIPYRFRNPKIDKPVFVNENLHRFYESNDIELEWTRAWYLGGEGPNPEKISFKYNVQLFNGGDVVSPDQAFLKKPIFEKNTAEEKLTIKWSDIESQVQVGNELYVRIVPEPSISADSIAFEGTDNLLGLTLCRPVSQDLFTCTSFVTISNLHHTEKTAKQLVGQHVSMGEFDMILGEDVAKDDRKANTFKGTAQIEWRPGGFKTMVQVKFDTLSINTDMVAFGGQARTYCRDSKTESDAAGVNKLFTDWGLDNLTGAGGSYSYHNDTPLDKDDPENAITVNVDVEGYFKSFHNMTGTALTAANKLGSAELDKFYCPARIPDGINTGPLDLQIANMTFTPYYATMNVVGELQIGEEAKSSNILMFGAPRLCISPTSLIPEAGTIALLADYGNIKDPKTGYTCRFKAPSNLTEPTDGCYLAWKNYEFGELGIDVDMKIPNLKKVEDGHVTKKKPILNIKTTINSWDSWVASATLDPFQVENLPGWTFTAQDLVLDHSKTKNHENMPAFPNGYDKAKAGLSGENPEFWQGLFIKDIRIKFPESISVGSSRMELTFNNMFIDKSGLTLRGGVSDVYAGKTAKMGGWSFDIKEVGISFIQSDFNNCYFSGSLGLPLLTDDNGKKALLDYNCELRRRITGGKLSDGTALLFTVQPGGEQNLNLDLFLAKVQLKKATTYFAAECVSGGDDPADDHTYVEFCMGGVIELGCKERIQKLGKSLSVDLNLPDVHFTGLRLANCSDDDWTSSYESIKKLQEARRAVSLNEGASILYYGGKTIHQGDFWFSTGQWSLASLEKQLGPFKFKLDRYAMDVSLQNNDKGSYAQVKLKLAGSVALVDGVSITAGAAVSVVAGVYNLSSITDITTDFEDVLLDSCAVDCSVAGMIFRGTLTTTNNVEFGKGFAAGLEVRLPGDLFNLNANGGYYKHVEGWTWGYLVVDVESGAGIPVPPIEFRGFSGGFYFNCRSSLSSPTDVTPKKGVIGAMLGVTIAAMGSDELFKGDFKLTVAYDTDHQRFTQFLFTGDMSAVSGLINAKTTLAYENNEQEQYMQISVTVDASLTPSKLLENLNMDGVSFASIDDITKSFANLEEEENNSSSGKKKGGEVKDTGAEKAKGARGLDLRILSKELGKKLARRKWHIYLGEPDEGKRIEMVLIDMNAKVVKLKVGANMYLCVGTELPGDGALPAIPEKIAKFLDGSTRGVGVQSDNISSANAARSAAANNFGGGISGGVMLGAQVFGALDVNLGIIKGGIDMLAGFDVSLRKLSGSAYCLNTGRQPGYHGWYGEGQLYAYLKLYMSLFVDLGFVDCDLPLFNAEMGGLLKMGGPAPTYFIGKCRAKVNLLGGLVKFNKKFEFECGEVCQVFRGNPLDDFILYDRFTVGDTLRDVGWDDKNRIAPRLTQSPRVYANASLEEHFRMLDENELQTILNDYNPESAESEDLEMQAERTFIFHCQENSSGQDAVILFRYANKDSKKAMEYHFIPILNKKGEFLQLDLNTLNTYLYEDSYYELRVFGEAKELCGAVEIDPLTLKDGKRQPIPWTQYTSFYFATGDGENIEDQAELQKYVALSYPGNLTELSDDVKDSETEKYRPVYYNDITAPTIALNYDIRNKAFVRGRVQWRVLTPKGVQIDAVDAVWVNAKNICSMEPKRTLRGIEPHQCYILSMDYLVVNDLTRQIDTIRIGRQHFKVEPKSLNWQSGSVVNSKQQNLDYEKPFVVTRLDALERKEPTGTYTDYGIGTGGKYDGHYIYTYDPCYYFSYLSNWAYISGRQVESSYFQGMYVTTTQSALMTIPGAGTYEGVFNLYSSDNILRGKKEVENIMFYGTDQCSALYGRYPLPTTNNTAYDFVGIVDPRIHPHYASTSLSEQSRSVRNEIKDYYTQLQEFDRWIYNSGQSWLSGSTGLSTKETQLAYLKARRGTYICYADDDIFQLPFYQVAIVASPMVNMGNVSHTNVLGNLGNRSYRESQIYALMNQARSLSYSKWEKCIPHVESQNAPSDLSNDAFYKADVALKRITRMKTISYRVNAFDLATGRYIAYDKLLNGKCVVNVDITDPYGSLEAKETSSQGSYSELGVSSGSLVGGKDFNTTGTAEMESAMQASIGYIKLLLEEEEKMERYLADVKINYKSLKSLYDDGMSQIVSGFNKKIVDRGGLPDIGSLSNLNRKVTTDSYSCYPDECQQSTQQVFGSLQTLYDDVCRKNAGSTSMLLQDAKAQLERGKLIRDGILENYAQILDMRDKSQAMTDEYCMAYGMLTLENIQKAEDIDDHANTIYTALNTKLKKAGNLEIIVGSLEISVKDIKSQQQLQKDVCESDNTFAAKYDQYKVYDGKLQSRVGNAKTMLGMIATHTAYVQEHQEDVPNDMVEMAKVSPRGTKVYKDVESLVTKTQTLMTDRGYLLTAACADETDLNGWSKESSDMLALLKMHAEAEPYYLAMKKLCDDIDGLYSTSKGQGLKKSDYDTIVELSQKTVEHTLAKCFYTVTRGSTDASTFNKISASTTAYKNYRKAFDDVDNMKKDFEQRCAGLESAKEKIANDYKEMSQNYNTYCNKQTELSYVSKATAMVDTCKKHLEEVEILQQTSSARLSRVLNDIKKAYHWDSLYHAPTDIYNGADELNKLFQTMAEQKDLMKTLSTSMAPYESRVTEIFREFTYRAQQFSEKCNEYYAPYVHNKTYIDKIEPVDCTQEFTFTVHEGDGMEEKQYTGHIFTLLYDYVLPAYDVASAKLKDEKELPAEYWEMESLYKSAKQQYDVAVENIPRWMSDSEELPDWVNMYNEFSSLFRSFGYAYAMDKASEVHALTLGLVHGIFDLYLKAEIADIKKNLLISDSDYDKILAYKKTLSEYKSEYTTRMSMIYNLSADSADVRSNFQTLTELYDGYKQVYDPLTELDKYDGAGNRITSLSNILNGHDEAKLLEDITGVRTQYEQMMDIVESNKSLANDMGILKRKLDQVKAELQRRANSYINTIKQLRLEVNALSVTAKANVVNDATITQLKSQCKLMESALCNCFIYVTGNPGDGKTFRNLGVQTSQYTSYQNFRTALKQKVAAITASRDTLSQIKPQIQSIKKKLTETYTLYRGVEISRTQLKTMNTVYTSSMSTVASVETICQACDDISYFGDKEVEQAELLAKANTSYTVINSRAKELSTLRHITLPQQLSEVNTRVSKLQSLVSGLDREWKYGIDVIQDAFDQQSEEIRNGFASLVDEFDFIENEGEQGFEEEHTVTLLELWSDFLVPAIEQSSKSGSNITSNSDFEYVRSTYSRLKSGVERMSNYAPSSLPDYIAILSQYKQIEEQYFSVSRYFDRAEYLTRANDNYDDALNNLIQLEAERLRSQFVGFGPVYEAACSFKEQYLQPYEDEYNRGMLGALNKLDVNAADAQETVDRLTEFLSRFNFDSEYQNVKTLSNSYTTVINKAREIYNLCEVSGKEGVAYNALNTDEMLERATTVGNVLSAYESLKKKMATFATKLDAAKQKMK